MSEFFTAGSCDPQLLILHWSMSKAKSSQSRRDVLHIAYVFFDDC